MNMIKECTTTASSELARYAVTGTFEGTFYAAAEDQLDKVMSLVDLVSPELVAKTALYCRLHGRQTDIPAFLVAHLAARDVASMERVFPRVVDDGRTLRSFVQFVRSGVTGRRSFGSAPKRALKAWFAGRTPDVVFRQSIGQSPSMSDVIKMVRPSPRNDTGEADAVREALYGYLIGKNVDRSMLPPLAKAFDAFKNGDGPVPDVPFEMLTALPLRSEHWADLAKKMTITQLRTRLNVLLRHGVLEDAALVETIAAQLSDPEAIRRTHVMPFQMLTAYRTADPKMPSAILTGLSRGLELAIANVPSLDGRRVIVCPDVSGSMYATIGDTPIRAVDAAALFCGALVQKNSGRVVVVPFTNDSAMERVLDREEADLVVVLSDTCAWDVHRARNRRTKLALVDLRRRGTAGPDRVDEDVLHVAGTSDAVFDVLAAFADGHLTGGFLETIEAVAL